MPAQVQATGCNMSLNSDECEIISALRDSGARYKRLVRRMLDIPTPRTPDDIAIDYTRRGTSSTPQQLRERAESAPIAKEKDHQKLEERFGKALRPYRRHLRKVTPKGIWFNTRFGVKKLRVNRVGMYIKASRKNFYLHKW